MPNLSRTIVIDFVFQVRQRISDFSVLISIIAMVLLDYFIGLPTPKLTVPGEFKVCSKISNKGLMSSIV
jgi:hypothetical protein